MPLYMLYRARCFETMGFTGFEGRHYSLFESLPRDMSHAANLQMLVTSLAFKYIISGRITHADIPDHPVVESERRQIFFGAAVGIPTFYVKTKTPNRFLGDIVKNTPNTRHSRRYSGYTRVRADDFQRALIERLKCDAPDLIEQGGFTDTILDLEARVEVSNDNAVSCRLRRRICQAVGAASPMALSSDEFNAAAESFYREKLKKDHMGEALDSWSEQVKKLDGMSSWRNGYYNQALFSILGGKDAATYIAMVRSALISEALPLPAIVRLIHLMLLTLDFMKRGNGPRQNGGCAC
jgi:hypothetical protein